MRLAPRLRLVALASALLATLRLPAQAPIASASSTRAPSVREGMLDGAGGVRLFYRVVGRGGDTVVVMHGGPGGDMENLAPDLMPLAERHVLIFYDQRGGGRSALPVDTTLLDARWFVEDLEAVRRHFALDRMTIVAHSFGPVLVARYAQAYPRRVRRLVFVGAIGPRLADTYDYARAVYERMSAPQRTRMAELARRMQAGDAGDPVALCRDHEALGRDVERSIGLPAASRATQCAAPPSAQRYAQRYTSRVTFGSLGAWDFTRPSGALTGVDAPLLVVWGDRDPSPIASQRAWAAAVADGRLLVVPGAGHAPHAERPNVVLPAIERFLAGQWPEGAAPER